jgi:hypothetical protein
MVIMLMITYRCRFSKTKTPHPDHVVAASYKIRFFRRSKQHRLRTGVVSTQILQKPEETLPIAGRFFESF